MTDRIRQFKGIHNFRDYGGYAAADGARVREGVLFRSGQHAGATPDDLAGVAALKLRTVIDLRGNSERAYWPCARPEGFDAQVLFFDGETAGAGGAPHIEAARTIVTAEDAHAAMVALYAFMPFRPNLQSVLRRYFEALATRDGASLLHCFAGKDRTGFAAALLHDLLGVHADDAMVDYMLTNVAGDSDARIAAGAASIRRSRGAQVSDAAIVTLMNVSPDYLTAALTAIADRHGSVRAYARDVLCVDDSQLAAIRERLLV